MFSCLIFVSSVADMDSSVFTFRVARMGSSVLAFSAGALATTGLVLWLWLWLFRPSRLARRVVGHISTRDTPRKGGKFRSRLRVAATTLLERIGSTSSSVQRRLAVIGTETVADFRLRQLHYATWGGGAGVMVGLSTTARGWNVLWVLVFTALGALAGAFIADSQLTKTAQETSAQFTRELPDVVELLALCVGSGEPVRVAMQRLTTAGQGVLLDQFRRTLAAVNAGQPFSAAMTDLGIRCDNPNVARFADSVTAAIEQGSGLTTTLYAQARDSRDAARRELLEQGGKAEIAMMVPVVFLILPITVLFTIFPAISTLDFL